MIFNKLVITSLLSPAAKQQPPNLGHLNKNKKINSKVKQAQAVESTDKQPLSFDDTICFTQLHKTASKYQKKKQLKSKKCVSQVLTIKNYYLNTAERKEAEQNSTFQASSFREIEGKKTFQLISQYILQKEFEKEKFGRTSHTTIRKNSLNKLNQEYIQPPIQRPLTQQKYVRNRSNFNRSKLPFTFDHLSNNQKVSSKSYEKGLIIENNNRQNEAKSSAKQKKSCFFEYSIIKPDQIKPIALKKREQESQIKSNRRKEYRMIYEQILQQMRRKEGILQRNAYLRDKKTKQRQFEERSNLHTSYIKPRKQQVSPQEKNYVKPWEVQANGPQISQLDIL